MTTEDQEAARLLAVLNLSEDERRVYELFHRGTRHSAASACAAIREKIGEVPGWYWMEVKMLSLASKGLLVRSDTATPRYIAAGGPYWQLV